MFHWPERANLQGLHAAEMGCCCVVLVVFGLCSVIQSDNRVVLHNNGAECSSETLHSGITAAAAANRITITPAPSQCRCNMVIEFLWGQFCRSPLCKRPKFIRLRTPQKSVQPLDFNCPSVDHLPALLQRLFYELRAAATLPLRAASLCRWDEFWPFPVCKKCSWRMLESPQICAFIIYNCVTKTLFKGVKETNAALTVTLCILVPAQMTPL